MAPTTSTGDGGTTAHGRSSRTPSSRISGPPVRLLQRPVHPAHRCALPGVPAGRAADRHHRVRAVLAPRGLTQRHRGAQREPDGGHPGVAGGPGPGHRGVDVEQLAVADRVPPPGAAVSAQVEGHHVDRAGKMRR